MEIWLDTVNIELIKKAQHYGILHGVTTNPTLLAKLTQDDRAVFQQILSVQDGPLTAQVTATEAEAMIAEADQLHAFSKRIIVKIPVTQEGLKAIHQLSRQGIRIMATTLFHPNQALLAALAGAEYIAPYLGRMENAGDNAMHFLKAMMKIFTNYRFETKILAASIKDPSWVTACAELGVHAVTLKDEVFNVFMEDHPLTVECLETMNNCYAQRK